MRAISLHQPWASLIAIGVKEYETRSWRPNWCNERIAIHAAKRWTVDQNKYLNRLMAKFPVVREKIHATYGIVLVPLGGIVATANLVSCLPATTVKPSISELEEEVGDWSYGRWVWKLEDIEIVHPSIAVPGRQGFFEW